MKTTITKTIITKDSNIAKILSGKTRGYQDWYVRYILSNSSNYTIQKK